MSYLDTRNEENKELIINRLVKKVIVYKHKLGIVFYPCDASFVKANSNGPSSSGSNLENGNGPDPAGSSPITFAPPNRFPSEPVVSIYNINGFLCLVLDRHPE